MESLPLGFQRTLGPHTKLSNLVFQRLYRLRDAGVMNRGLAGQRDDAKALLCASCTLLLGCHRNEERASLGSLECLHSPGLLHMFRRLLHPLPSLTQLSRLLTLPSVLSPLHLAALTSLSTSLLNCKLHENGNLCVMFILGFPTIQPRSGPGFGKLFVE